MQEVNEVVIEGWRLILEADTGFKLDDLGDAFLHAIGDLVCGSSNYRQLSPATSVVLYNNRTVAVSIFPHETYWAVVLCKWNCFLVEDLGMFNVKIEGTPLFSSPGTKHVIKDELLSCRELADALTSFQGAEKFTAVDHIKVVVKQQTAHKARDLHTRVKAGGLTNSAVQAMQLICDDTMGDQSKLTHRKDKLSGNTYLRVHSGKKFQVVRSTGKHTNALLSVISFSQQHLPDYVVKRRLALRENEKWIFYKELKDRSLKDAAGIESIQLSDVAKRKMASKEWAFCDKDNCRNYSDLILVALNKNMQRVKAVAANYRKARQAVRGTPTKRSRTNPAADVAHDVPIEHDSV